MASICPLALGPTYVGVGLSGRAGVWPGQLDSGILAMVVPAVLCILGYILPEEDLLHGACPYLPAHFSSIEVQILAISKVLRKSWDLAHWIPALAGVPILGTSNPRAVQSLCLGFTWVNYSTS